MSKSKNDFQNLELNMKLTVEREEGIPMSKRKSASLYDQLTPELITLSDKQGLFIVNQKAKNDITQFRYWLKAFEKAQDKFSYFAQVGYNGDMKVGIRIWCFIKSTTTNKNKTIQSLGGAGKTGKGLRGKGSPGKK